MYIVILFKIVFNSFGLATFNDVKRIGKTGGSTTNKGTVITRNTAMSNNRNSIPIRYEISIRAKYLESATH